MIVQIDFNRDEWQEFAAKIPDEDYRIVEEYWEDSDEWAIIEVTAPESQQWIRIHHSEWIVS